MASEGPAWTREIKKKGKRTARPAVSPAPSAEQQQAPFYSASASNSASSSSLLHLPPQQEAPYLTHVVRNPLGQITLVPPDNLGRQRQRGEGDATSVASGSTADEPPAPKIKKKRKKKPDAAILDAVVNAGRISPAAPGGAGEVRSTSRGTEDQGPDSVGRAEEMARSSSSQRQADRARNAAAEAAQARQTSALAAAPELAVAPAYSGRTARTPAEHLDSHHSLVATATASVDREESPPPAYPARSRSPSPQPPSLDLSSPVPPLQSSPIRPTPDFPGLTIPSPPDLSQLAIQPDETFIYNEQDPFVLAWEADRAAGLALEARIERDLERRRAAASGGVPAEEDPPSSEDEEVATPTQSEQSAAGDEVSRSYASAASNPMPSTRLSSLYPTPEAPIAPQPDWRPAPDQTRSSEDVVASWQRREIAAAEATQDAPRVARALSVYAGRRFAEAAERRIARAKRRAEGGRSSTAASSVIGEEEHESQGEELKARGPVEEEEAPSQSAPAASSPASVPVARPPTPTPPIPSASETISPSALQSQEDGREEAEQEEEEEEEEESDEETTARAVPLEAHRRFAEAAERRIAAARAAQEQERAEQEEFVKAASGQAGTSMATADVEDKAEESLEAEERGQEDEDTMPSSTYALLFPSSAKPFGSPATAPPTASPAPSFGSTQIQPLPQPVATSPLPADPLLSPSPRSSVTASQAAIAPRSPSPVASAHSTISAPVAAPAPPVPASAFAEIANAFSSGPDTSGLAATLRPFSRPRALTINELLSETFSSPSRGVARSQLPDSPPQLQRRPPPVPPARPSSLYNRDLPIPPSPSQISAPTPNASSAPLLTHIPPGEQDMLRRPLQPTTFSRPPPPPILPIRPLPLQRRPPPPPPPARDRISTLTNQQSASSDFSPSGSRSNAPLPSLQRSTRQSNLVSVAQPPHSSAETLPQATSPTPSQARRRPLPVPPSPPPLTATSTSPRIDAYTALRERVEAFDVARERERALARLEGSEERDLGGPVVSSVSRGSLQPAESGLRALERPRSATSSFEVPDEPNAAAREEHADRQPPTTAAQAQEFAAYTDLDLLLARLEGDHQREGTNYEDLNILGEVLGPAQAVGASEMELETLAVARVELERRRIDKHGKVKLKLSVVGVRCIDCSICLTRFRVDDLAVILPACLHAFHETCVRSWLARSRQCPLCRVDVFPPRNIDI